MAPQEGVKRKDPPGQDGGTQVRVKRVKFIEARQIRSEPSHKALNERKELDVGSFVKSHDFEIRALERSITNSKSALSQRAFQQVPRQLRRRTASHNVKKVPKRLRARAAREMKEDKTPTHKKKITGKQRLRTDLASSKRKPSDGIPAPSTLADHPKEKHKLSGELATAPVLVHKHRKRQLKKAWLPTHMFHAKRAHMSSPMKPLWGFALPITPTEKSYRQTHRAYTLRGCVAWDMSYMSTIEISGSEECISKALSKLSAHSSNLAPGKLLKWKQGKQTWTGFLFGITEENSPIAPVTIIWNPAEAHTKARRILIRVHPTAFAELWTALKKVGSMQRPMLKIRDMRFEYGSIEVTGPASMEAIVRTVQPLEMQPDALKKWAALAAITNISTLPRDMIVAFSMKDTRLKSGLRTLHQNQTRQQDAEFLEFISNWPPDSDHKPFALMDDQNRKVSQQQKLSQKTIERWKAAGSGGEDDREGPNHHAIPAILYALQRDYADGMSGSWILMLPWEHVLPTWYSLMHVGLVDGGQPRLGGLREQRQRAFESESAWFPGDFPITAAGWAWENREREQRMQEWAKRPKSKRIDFDNLDLGHERRGELGRGWACDWEYLLELEQHNPDALGEKEARKAPDSKTSADDTHQSDISQSHDTRKPSPIKSDTLALVSITTCGRGHLSTCARIYRLPTEAAQRRAWLNLTLIKPTGKQRSRQRRGIQYEVPPVRESAEDLRKTPPAEDLVGFVTSGNYNLGEGRATAIGSVHLQKILDSGDLVSTKGINRGWCIIREAGETVPRLARWEQQPYSRAFP